MIIARRQRSEIQIEHQIATNLSLVGLQVWRGALVLADLLIHYRKKFAKKRLLELGSGVGLTSIAGGIYAEKDIVCTDIDLGGILELIKKNVEMNKKLIKHNVNIHVMELDFRNMNWSNDLQKAIRESNVIFAADGK